MDDIIKLINITDHEIVYCGCDIDESTRTKTISLEKKLREHYCPNCGFRMYSKGVKARIANHPVMQDGYKVRLNIRQRRWKCSNENCKLDLSDHFEFLESKRRNTNASDLLIVNSFRDYSRTAASIGRQFNVSDHHALNVFDRYVQLDRLPLPEILCVDEVYLDMDPYCKYVLVLQDFVKGESVDLVVSRRKSVTDDYFMSIPFEERSRVKYLISDMYNPYIHYCDTYFVNAIPIVDSFHVIQWLLRKLDLFLVKLLKQYKAHDEERFVALPPEKRKQVSVPLSDEVYLLQNCRWVLLKNQANINYALPSKMNYHFGCHMDTYSYESRFLALHEDLPKLRDLKEKYILFNSQHYADVEKASSAFDLLIEEYFNCGLSIFEEFAATLKRFRQPILNSFIHASKLNKASNNYHDVRLSNGPIESLNRHAKDLKRNGRGYSNFSHIRNRFLFSTRLNPHIKG